MVRGPPEHGEWRARSTCGATVFWTLDTYPDVVAVAVGAFADPTFPAPKIAVYEERRHAWTAFAELELERYE